MNDSQLTRNGYSLLEVMIAMSLLVGLLAAAWSMLATYRDAEMRGWTLVNRIRTVESARTWLETDLLNVVSPQPFLATAQATAQATDAPSKEVDSQRPFQWVGNSQGFTAVIKPSVDPLPMLDQLFDAANESTVEEREPLLKTTMDSLDDPALRAMSRTKTPDHLTIEYRLVSEGGDDSNDASESWTLVRRELVDQAELRTNQSSETDFQSEPELTLSDLYRVDDQSRSSLQVARSETQLPGLINAKFAFFDGQEWKSSWNSGSTGKLPAAISLSFDLPQGNSAARPHATLRSATDSDNSPIGDSELDDDRDASDWLTEPTAESESADDALTEYDVRIVIGIRP